jgi:hypothetical protein
LTDDASNPQEEPVSETKSALYKVAFDESLRNLNQQQSVLAGIHGRAGLLITAANVITAFLGGAAIKTATGSIVVVNLSLGGWLALATFAGVMILAISILWPWDRWNFAFDVDQLLAKADEPGVTLPWVHSKLAGLNEDSFRKNEKQLRKLFSRFAWAAVLLLFEAVFWVMSLAQIQIGPVLF